MRPSLSVLSSTLLALSFAAPTAALDQPMIGAPAPGFDLPSLDGDRVALADLRGQTVVLHFGTGW